MQEKIKKVLDSLKKEKQYYAKLLDFSKDKNESLKNRKLDDISIITQKEEKLVANIQETEKSRVTLLKEISELAEINFEDLSLTKLSEICENETYKTKIIDLKNDLNHILSELREINERNTELIKQSLNIINDSLKIMDNTVNNPNIYAKNRKDAKNKNQTSYLFDKKI
jgi:flagellar biosynthesis/type III secretory pathway chaperone